MIQIQKLAGQEISQVIHCEVMFDASEPFHEQVGHLIDQVELSTIDWQTVPLIICPPSLNFITAALLAELHGRMGYFPAIIRMRLVSGMTPPVYEVAEIINLQNIREAARGRRK